jgi:hypothetical protein
MSKSIQERVDKLRNKLQQLMQDCVDTGDSFELEVWNPRTEVGGKIVFNTTEFNGWNCSDSPDYVGHLEWKND